MKFQFDLNKINIMILKSLDKEEKLLLHSTNLLNKNTEYKEYLSFILNNFSMNLNIKENFYLDMNLKIFNFYLLDTDFFWKINERGNIQETSILNSEFSVFKKNIYYFFNFLGYFFYTN